MHGPSHAHPGHPGGAAAAAHDPARPGGPRPAGAPAPPSLIGAGLVGAGFGFLGLQLWAFVLAGGVFEYPLDDVYIHMAMAEGIARGSYGVTPGTLVAASSSALYPLLLAPLSGQIWAPLAFNALAVLGAGALWGAAVARAGLGRAGVWVAGLGALALNIPGVGFTGMENSLHAVAALALVLALWRFAESGRIGGALVAAAVIAPLLRLEGLALSLLAAGMLALCGRARAGGLLALAVLAPVAGFAAFLMALGLPPLPGSVLAKLTLTGPEAAGGIAHLAQGLALNLATPAGRLMAWLSGALLLGGALLWRQGDARRAAVAGVLALAGLAHLAAGQIGWMHRYEHYAIVAQMAGLALLAGALRGTPARVGRVALPVFLGLAALAFWPKLVTTYVWGPRAIHLQQAQTARLVQAHWRAPVAVNDLGRVAWGNPAPVLDLYGLGAPDALALRMRAGGPPAGWAGDLARAHGVGLVAIYDAWFGADLGPGWVRLGDLRMIHPRGALGAYEVAFHATPEAAARARAALAEWTADLPRDAVFVPEGQGAGQGTFPQAEAGR